MDHERQKQKLSDFEKVLQQGYTVDSLAEEYAALPEEEQQTIELKRYGVEQYIRETPELIRRCLRLLEEAINTIEDKEAYETALFVIPDHVTCERFVLAFLRAVQFDVDAAAQRMVNYWERKVELFGTERAFRPYLSIFDLKEEDFPSLRKGGIRLLPVADEAGRALLFKYIAYFGKDVDVMARVFWYVTHKALWFHENSDDIQRKGFVFFNGSGMPAYQVQPFDSFQEFGRHLMTTTRDTTSVLPLRVPAIYAFLLDSKLFRFLGFVPREIRTVLNAVTNNDDLQELSYYGIPPTCIPVEIGGNLEVNYNEILLDMIMEDFEQLGIAYGPDDISHLPENIKLLCWKLMHPEYDDSCGIDSDPDNVD